MQKNAFTLFEIMISIAIIWIIFLWVSKLNFKNISDRQRLEWFFYEVKNNLEEAQTNALLWKAIKEWTDIVVPDFWEINFNNSWNWIIVSDYTKDGNIYEYNKIIPKPHYYIETYYKDLDWKKIDETETWTILIKDWNLTLTWITTDTKKLEIKIGYKQFEKILYINTISWVIEEK